MASTLEWFHHFTIALRVGWSILCDNGSAVFDSGEFRLVTIGCLNCQNSDIRTNNPCCSVLLWTSLSFLQVNQQKLNAMVSTNDITHSEQIYKPF